ncbi:MAG: hypothetical protein RM368_29985 [Nostoc sp. DedSLP03]|uniref:hypothetical protein n=1 Tax=Nostoc sp. DedSLP03 TaxID=3075400 RepID=UPI002AD4ADA0|nr:hypothetical protein [Nostoc sp. DedSLP03]MDZ7969133.1 hypothetical protein [Nostoc sp. DedSLP03]
MDSEEALDFIKELVELDFPNTNRRLTNVEEQLIRGAWIDKTYKEIHAEIRKKNEYDSCGLEHLEKNIASKLWRFLSDLLKNGKVNKKGLRAVVEATWRRQQQEALSQPEQGEQEIPLPNSPNPVPPLAPGNQAGSQSGILSPETLSINDQYIFQYTIALIVENPKDIRTRENVLRETRVIPVKEDSLKLFGLFNTPFDRNNNWRLEDLLNHLPQENNRRWLEELAESVFLALRRRLNHSGSSSRKVQSTFRSSDGKLFRAILHTMKILSDDGSLEFIVIFEEHISRGYVENPPSMKYATLVTAINLGSRLRCEVCDKYLQMLDDAQRQGLELIKKVLREVKNSYEYIKEEAELRRQGEADNESNEDRLRECFDYEHEREEIKNNLLKQEVYKQTLLIADTYDNINEVKVALTELNYLNEIVMHMVIKRFGELF